MLLPHAILTVGSVCVRVAVISGHGQKILHAHTFFSTSFRPSPPKFLYPPLASSHDYNLEFDSDVSDLPVVDLTTNGKSDSAVIKSSDCSCGQSSYEYVKQYSITNNHWTLLAFVTKGLALALFKLQLSRAQNLGVLYTWHGISCMFQ